MQPLREDQEGEQVGGCLQVYEAKSAMRTVEKICGWRHTYFDHPIACHDKCQNSQIQPGEDGLGYKNVLSPLCKLVEYAVDEDMCRRIDQGAGAPFDQGVITFAIEVLGDLLHVSFPIDFRV